MTKHFCDWCEALLASDNDEYRIETDIPNRDNEFRTWARLVICKNCYNELLKLRGAKEDHTLAMVPACSNHRWWRKGGKHHDSR